MPTYQYRCTNCQQELEVVQKFTDSALTVCPSCEGELRKIYNAVGVVFKGSGFYKTDSRSGTGAEKSNGSATGSSSSSKDGAGAAKESGSSSTPAPKESSSSASTPAKSGTSSS